MTQDVVDVQQEDEHIGDGDGRCFFEQAVDDEKYGTDGIDQTKYKKIVQHERDDEKKSGGIADEFNFFVAHFCLIWVV